MEHIAPSRLLQLCPEQDGLATYYWLDLSIHFGCFALVPGSARAPGKAIARNIRRWACPHYAAWLGPALITQLVLHLVPMDNCLIGYMRVLLMALEIYANQGILIISNTA